MHTRYSNGNHRAELDIPVNVIWPPGNRHEKEDTTIECTEPNERSEIGSRMEKYSTMCNLAVVA
jgi:hypothetical protein